MDKVDIIRKRLKENYYIAECVGQSLNVELNKEIDNSINDLMKKFKSNPSDKETAYKIDDLVALRDEVLNRLRVCETGSRTIEKEV